MDGRGAVLLLFSILLISCFVLGLVYVDHSDVPIYEDSDGEKADFEHPHFLESHIHSANLTSHLAKFQTIARLADGSRSMTSSGYNASVTYVASRLRAETDYEVSVQLFFIDMSFPVTRDPAMVILTPTSASSPLTYKKDYVEMGFTGGGYVEASVSVAKNLGCIEADYAHIVPGNVVLVMRGVCGFSTKAQNAIAAGAGAVLICNDGADPSREDIMEASVGKLSPVPVYFTSAAVGRSIIDARKASVTVTVALDILVELKAIPAWNILADTPAGNKSNTVVLGSHLDSVTAGPGINDNGSGSSTTLEVALWMYRTGLSKEIRNRVRFGWWAAEELGLIGSEYYVDSLSPDERKLIACNVNIDMIASPNYIRAIYDGRNAEDQSIRGGSGAIQGMFEEFFDSAGLTHTPRPFDGRSDYGPFIARGIPAGGVATGAETLKTLEEARLFGGVPNVALDPCYHQRCDTLENVNMEVLLQMAKATAYVTQKLAMDPNLHNVTLL